MANRLKAANAEEYDKATKEDILTEIGLRIEKDKSPNFGEVKPSDTKPILIAALVADDAHLASKPEETAELKSGGKAVAIPKVDRKDISHIVTHNAPPDELFTRLAKRDFDGQLYAVAVHEPNNYGRTVTCKNSASVWEGTQAQFRAEFVLEK